MYKGINRSNNSETENANFSISLPAIDSILSMDDTILNSIENDNKNDRVFSVDLNIHEKTLNSFTHEWSVHDIFEIHKNSEKSPPTVNSEGDQQIKIAENDALSIPYNVQNEKNNSWQDETFMNEVFAQLDSSNEKNVGLECPSQVIYFLTIVPFTYFFGIITICYIFIITIDICYKK